MPPVLRPAEPRDRAALLRLFANVFESEPNESEWSWKYERNPHRAVSIVALEGDDAVGFFGGLATRYRGADGERPGASGIDIMTRPAARRLGHAGLYREMGRLFIEENRKLGLPFVFGFPHSRARAIGERLLGYRMVEAAGLFAAPIRAPGLLRRLRRRRSKVRSEAGLSNHHDELAEVLHTRPGLRTDRSRTTLAWRLAKPGAGYLLFELLDVAGRSRAYAAVRVIESRALFADLQVRDEEAGDLADLLDAVGDGVRRYGASRFEVRAPRTGRLAQRLVTELGFVAEESDTWLETMVVDADDPFAHRARELDYRFLDHDVF